MPIDVKELRIGNYYEWSFIASMGIGVDFIKDGKDIDRYQNLREPIPLTAEVLLACGFKNPQGDYWMKDNDLLLAFDSCWWWTNSWEPDGEFGFEALATYREINYLHQLQNLYHALTGKELTYNTLK